MSTSFYVYETQHDSKKRGDEMSDKTFTCKNPKCGERVHDYVRKGTAEWKLTRCYHGCGMRFKINLKDYFKEDTE